MDLRWIITAVVFAYVTSFIVSHLVVILEIITIFTLFFLC